MFCNLLARLVAAGAVTLLGTPAVGETPPRPIPLPNGEWYGALAPDGQTLGTTAGSSGNDYHVRLRDRASSALLDEVNVGPGLPRGVAFAPDGHQLAVLSWGELFGDRERFLIRLWDISARRTLIHPHVIRPEGPSLEPPPVYHFAFSPDGKTLAAATGWEIVTLWETTTGQLRRAFLGGVAVGFSADGRTLFAVTHDGLVRRFAFPSCQPIGPDEPGARTDFLHVTQVAFSADGRLVALGDDWTVVVKEVATETIRCRLNPPGRIWSYSLSPDDKLLAVVTREGAYLYDAATGSVRTRLEGAIDSLAFCQGGRYLACRRPRSIEFLETAAVLAKPNRGPVSPWVEPADAPLEVELLAQRKTYRLDLQGDTPTEASNRIQFGDRPDPPEVDLILQVRNRGKVPIRVKELGPRGLILHLAGPGAINVLLGSRYSPLDDGHKVWTLTAGETFRIPVNDLGWNVAGFWLLPGEYTVAGSCAVGISPAPKGTFAMGREFGLVRASLGPVAIRVTAGPQAPLPRSVGPLDQTFRLPRPGTVWNSDTNALLIPALLVLPIDLERGIDKDTPLEDALAFLRDRSGLPIRIDEAAFAQAGRPGMSTKPVRSRALHGVTRHGALHIVLTQVDADLRVGPDAVWIIPQARPRGLADCLRPGRLFVHKRLGRGLTLELGIGKDTPLLDAVEFLSDRSGIDFLVDLRAFQRAGMKEEDVCNHPVQLPPQKGASVGTVLQRLLDQIGATYVLRDRVVLIVPTE
jgi:hypothetical protein